VPSLPVAATLPRPLRALACVVAIAAAACAGPARDGRPFVDVPLEADRTARHDVPGLPNLARVDDGLWRAGQPTAGGFAAAKALGVRTIVDLRGSRDDRALVGPAGLDLVVVRTGARRLDEDDVVAFLRVAMDPARRPVLVHCASGHDRTGAMVAAYRVVALDWPKAQALEEMRRFGAAPWYDNLVEVIERLDPAEIRARAAAGEPGGSGALPPAMGASMPLPERREPRR
jgi:protein tyrosine phosphatase (PTP) superfamily phosphohydrolase (DUF442 family)